MGIHTVEKIGGTSMSRFGEVMKNVIIGSRKENELYNRIFVVSAYSGITNLLLEDKKTGAPGVYGYVSSDDPNWEAALAKVRAKMLEYNRSFESIGLNVKEALSVTAAGSGKTPSVAGSAPLVKPMRSDALALLGRPRRMLERMLPNRMRVLRKR